MHCYGILEANVPVSAVLCPAEVQLQWQGFSPRPSTLRGRGLHELLGSAGVVDVNAYKGHIGALLRHFVKTVKGGRAISAAGGPEVCFVSPSKQTEASGAGPGRGGLRSRF